MTHNGTTVCFAKAVFLLALFSLMSSPTFAYDFMVDSIAYNILSDSTVAVTYSSGARLDNYAWATNFKIPETVAHDGNVYTVKEIGPSAFDGCLGINKITLPNTIESIRSPIPYVKSLNIPSSVVFEYNKDLTFSAGELFWDYIGAGIYDEVTLNYVGHLVIGPNVKYIPRSLFKTLYTKGDDFTTLFIPKNVCSVNVAAFTYTNFKTLIIEDGTDFYVDGETALASFKRNQIIYLKGDVRGILKPNTNERCKVNSESYIFGREVTRIRRLSSYSRYVDRACYAPTPPTITSYSSGSITCNIPVEAAPAYFADEHWANGITIYNDLIVPEKVEMTTKSKTLNVQGSFVVSATVTPSDVPLEKCIIWSTNPRIVSYDEDSKTALAVSPGEADLVICCVDRFDTCHVVVRDPELTLGTRTINVKVDTTETLTVTTKPVQAKKCLYAQSGNVYIAQVDVDDDMKVVIKGIGVGETDAYVKCGNRVEKFHIIVSESDTPPPPPNCITLEQTEVTLDLYGNITIGISSNEPVGGYTVTNNNPTIAFAQLINNGDNSSIRITALKPGKATVTVGSTDGEAVEATCAITVRGETDGDVNLDGEVNVADVSSIYRIVLGLDEDNGRADINFDGTVNAGDVSALYHVILGN